MRWPSPHRPSSSSTWLRRYVRFEASTKRLDDRDGREAGIPESPRNGRFRPEPTSGAASQILTPRCERSVFALSLGFESALLFEETHDALCCVIPRKRESSTRRARRPTSLDCRFRGNDIAGDSVKSHSAPASRAQRGDPEVAAGSFAWPGLVGDAAKRGAGRRARHCLLERQSRGENVRS